MVIEFTGIPGTGKTHCCSILEQMLIDGGREVVNRTDLCYFRNHRYVRYAMRKIVFIKKIFITNEIRSLWLNLSFGKYGKEKLAVRKKYFLNTISQQGVLQSRIKQNPNRIYLIDEGYIHLCGALLLFADRSKYQEIFDLTKAILEDTYKNQRFLSVFVEGDADQSYERICNRNQGWPSPAKDLTLHGKKDYLYKWSNIYTKLYEFMPDDVKISGNSNDLPEKIFLQIEQSF